MSKIRCEPKKQGLAAFFHNKRSLIRLGAFSGIIALGLAGYVKRKELFGIQNTLEKNKKGDDKKEIVAVELSPVHKELFYIANAQHMYHSLAIMGTPFVSKRPAYTTSFLLAGIILFCIPQYYNSLKEKDRRFGCPTWVGGFCLIAAWFTILL